MSDSRSKRALISSAVALVLEIVTTVSGLIIPRLILGKFGSEVNGMVLSITQFLGYVSLLQLGVGGVIRAAFYKPLAQNDNHGVSRVMRASNQFFGKIAIASGVYIALLAALYPLIKSSYNYFFVATLVIILGADTIAQYAWGFPNRQLIYADQRSYIYDFTRIISISLNVLLTVLLIKLGCSIHLVKLGSAVVFVLQPYVLNRYVVKRYKIIRNIDPDENAVKQRWAGVGYSLADFIHRRTDIFVLTILSSLKEVSVYSVYSLVLNGINSVISMATGSFQAAMGDMIAKKEENTINMTMGMYEFIVHTVSAIAFTTTLCLILPFVKLYTHGVTDAEYIRPLFAILIVIAEMLYCLRQPYQSIVLAAGLFKETQKGAIIEAVVNIVVSVVLVHRYGLIGVAIGTLLGMAYRTVDLLVYLHKHLLHIRYFSVIKRYFITAIELIIVFGVFRAISPAIESVFDWIIAAILILAVSTMLVCLINVLVFRENSRNIINRLRLQLKK